MLAISKIVLKVMQAMVQCSILRLFRGVRTYVRTAGLGGGSLLIGLVSLVMVAWFAGSSQASIPTAVTFLGEATLPAKLMFLDTEFGGLSGITYDTQRQMYYAVSDDRSEKAPARFYSLTVDLNQRVLKPNGMGIAAVTIVQNTDASPFAPRTVDLEGIALSRDRTLWISSEGDAITQIPPFVRQFSLQGQYLRELPIPEKFLPTTQQGVRQNLAFESLTLTPSERYLYVANENALIQDGAEATLDAGSLVRILRYRLPAGIPDGEFVYRTDPVVAPPIPSDGFNNHGLVELLALDDRGNFLALERSFSAGVGYTIRLYTATIGNATNVQAIPALSSQDMSRIRLVKKTLLFDLNQLGIPLTNLEGLTFTPRLPNGQRGLLIVGDNNFGNEKTQLLAFALQ